MPLNFCLSTLSLTATSTLSSLWNPEHVLSSLSIVLYDFSSGKWCFFQMIFLSSMNHFFFFFQIFSLVYSRSIFKKNRISYPSILTILILYLQRQCLLFLSVVALRLFYITNPKRHNSKTQSSCYLHILFFSPHFNRFSRLF